uniref:Uncharacterized protein n=1 Tax=Panagrolaimus superbus TaxID=310955 RepID=A0A914Z1E0_9BILA
MEKENTELYRNYSLLQSQLNQLERENAARATEANNNKKMKLEAEIHKLNQEKRQLEKIIEQREQNYLQKYKMFESQLNILREQLDAERRRRREITAFGATFQTANRRSSGGGGGGGKPPFRI